MSSLNMICHHLILLSLLYASVAWDTTSYDFNILVIVPSVLHDTTSSSTKLPSINRQSWQKSEELLTAAEFARRSVNRLNFPFNFSVTELRTDCKSAEMQIVRELTAADGRITVAVIGYFCKQVSRVLRITSPDRLGLIQIALNPHTSVDKNNWRYKMLPSTRVYAEALAQFMAHVGWTQIAIVYSQTPISYSFEMAEQMIQILNAKGFITVKINGNVEIAAHNRYNIFVMNTIKQIHLSGATVVYILLSPIETAQLICCAYDYGLRWPHYGWIVPVVSLEDVLNLSNCDPNAAQGILSVHMTNGVNNSKREAVKCFNDCYEEYESRMEVLNSNIYANALSKAILATAISLNLTFSEYQMHLARSSFTRNSKLIHQKMVSQMVGENIVNFFFWEAMAEYHSMEVN